jgi:hypothetical protein
MSDARKENRGSTFKYFLASGEVRYGYIYDGPPSPDGKRKQIRKTGFHTEREAIAELYGAVTKQETGVARPLSDPAQTLTEFLAAWMEEWVHRKLGRKTGERYRQLADYVLPRLGHVALKDLDLYVFEKVFDDLAKLPGKRGRPLSAKTIRNMHSVFHGAFDRAVNRYKTLKENPVDGCDLPKLRRRKVQSLEPAEIRSFAIQSLKDGGMAAAACSFGGWHGRASRGDASGNVESD